MDTLINNVPNWAEQLEAIATAVGALFALISIFVAWKAIRNQLKDQQENIETLTGVVKMLSLQSESLGKQTEALSESMKIDTNILIELTNHFAENKNIERLRQEKERKEAKPNISIKQDMVTLMKTNYYNVTNENQNDVVYNAINFTNMAEEFAKIESFESRRNKGVAVEVHTNFTIKFLKNVNLTPETLGYVNVLYEDIYGNRYEKIFIIKKGTDRLLFEIVSDVLKTDD